MILVTLPSSVYPAAVEGSVTVRRQHQGEGLALSGDGEAQSAPLADVPITLTGPTGAHSHRTDELGRFGFCQLVPGDWTIRCNPNTLPPHHRLLEEKTPFVLAPGETRAVGIIVLRAGRPAQLIEQGTLRIENETTLDSL